MSISFAATPQAKEAQQARTYTDPSRGAPPSRRSGANAPYIDKDHWNRVFTEPQYFDAIAKQKGMAEGAKVSLHGDDYVYRQAMIGYMSATRNVPLDDMRKIFDAEKDGFAKKVLGKQTASARELFDWHKSKFERDNEKQGAARQIMEGVIQRSLQDALSGGDTPFVESVAKDIDAASDFFDDEEKSRLWEKAEELDMKIRATQDRFAPEARFIFDALQQYSGQKEGFGAPDMRDLAGRFASLPDNQRRAIYELVSGFASITKTDKGFFYQLAESLGRGTTDITERVPRNAQEQMLRNDLRLLSGDQPVFRGTGIQGEAYSAAGTKPLTPEEREQAKADVQQKLGVFKVQRELRDLAERVVDPIKMTGVLPEIVEEGLYAAARSVPYTAVAAVPFVGMPAVAAALYSSNYDNIMLEYPDIDPDKAALLAAISAPIEAGLERMKVNTLTGRLPVFGGLVRRLQHPNQRNITRIAIGGAGIIAEQNVQEFVQEATFPIVRTIAAALDQDIPTYDWNKWAENLPRQLGVQFVALLPLSLIGMGSLSFREVARGERYMRDQANLSRLGFSQEQIDRVTTAATADEAQRMFREEYANRDPALVTEASNRILDDIIALRQQQTAPAADGQTSGNVTVGASFNYDGSGGGQAGLRTITQIATAGDSATPDSNPLRTVISFGDRDASGALIFVDPRYSGTSAASRTAADTTLPRLERRGADYVVLSPEGKELARSTDQTAAEQALVSARRETVQREMRDVHTGINEAMQFIQKVSEARQRGEDVAKFIRDNSPRTLLTDYEANPTQQNLDQLFETVRFFGQEINDPAELANFPVTGSNQGELREGIWRSIIRINEGADGTIVMREFAQDNLKRAISEGRTTMDFVRQQLNDILPQIDSARMERQLRTETDTDVIEAFSDVAVAYFRGSIREEQIPAGLRGIMRRLAIISRDIFRRAYNLARLRAEGKLDRDFEALLAEAVGVNQQALVDRARERTEQEVGAAENYSIAITPQQDTDYLAAVERGDMETAQRMVDEAARAAGYTFGPVWHGTRKEFTRFFNQPTYFSESEQFARYTVAGKQGRVIKAFLRGNLFDPRNPEHIAQVGEMERLYGKMPKNPTYQYFHAAVQNWLQENGWGGHYEQESTQSKSRSLVVFEPMADAKSADPVTYDASGNVIPLSQRFDATTTNINYSIATSDILSRYEGMPSVVIEGGRPYSPIVRDLLKRRAAGEDIPREVIDQAINENFPAQLVEVPRSVAELPDRAVIDDAIDKGQRDKRIDVSTIEAGEKVAIRQDVPAMTRKGVGVVTVKSKAGNSYEAAARITEPEFVPNEKKSLRIAMGEAKGPHIVINGKWAADQSMPDDLETWTQVGYNPDRHSFYYDRATMQQVTGGSEAYQIGNTVFVKDAQYGDGQISDISYSISTQSEIDRVQKAMDRLARSPSERISQYAALKERLAAALERNQPIMQSMRGDTLPQDFDRTRILNDLGFLDYILKVLPPEVRGRVGGYTNLAAIAPVDVYKGDQKVSEAKNPAGAIISAWMREGQNIGQAQKNTALPEGYSTVANTTDGRRDKTVANFLIDRLKKIDRELERYYKRDLMERIFDVLDKSRPKAGESGVKRSTLGAETQKFADMVYRASLLDDEKTAETLAAIEAKITSTEATDESQKRLSELSEEWTIVNTFGDLKNRPSETLAYGLEWLQEQLKAGREAWQIKEAARIQENRERAAKVVAFLGKPTDIGRFKNKSALQRFLQATNAYDLDHKSFEQFAFWLFGDEVAAELSEKIQRANISEAKAELENTRTILAAMRQGAKAAGMKTGKALVMFKENQSNAVRKLEGRKVKDTKISIELAKKIVRGLADRGSLSQADVQTLADELAALPRDTKKEFVTIKQVIFRGEEVRLTMSRSQAMQLWLTWQQSDAQEKMRRDGFTDDSFEDLDNLISDPFSQAILRVTQRIYGSGYPLTNPIYARMFGMNMPMVKNYAPARYLSSKEVKDVGLDGSPLTAGGQPSFAKSRVNHTAKLAPEDALTVLQSHIAQQAHWVAFAEVTREYRSLLANPEVRESIRQRFGEDVLRSAEMWGDQMEQRGGNKGREIAVINNALGAIIGGQSVSLLGLNLKSISMQTDNLMRFFLALNSRQIASALSDPVALMRNIRKVWKTDIIQTRLQGGATAETRFLFNRFVSMFRRGAKISELAMMPMNYTDSAGLSVSGAIVYQAAYKDALDSGMDERSAEQAATDAVEAMVYRYGQPVLMGQKSNIENSGGVFAKTFFLFMSDPRLKMAIISDAVRGLATGRGDWKDHVRRIVAVEMMAIVSHVLATAFRDATSDDDDEDLWSMGGFARALLLAPLQGYFLVGSVSEVVLSRLTEARWFTPTQNPFIRTADTAFKAFNNLDDAFNFDDPDALVKEWTNITRSIAVAPPLAAPAVIMNIVRPLVQGWERMDDDE